MQDTHQFPFLSLCVGWLRQRQVRRDGPPGLQPNRVHDETEQAVPHKHPSLQVHRVQTDIYVVYSLDGSCDSKL